MCGKDGKFIKVRFFSDDFGFVGEIIVVDISVVKGILNSGYFFVIVIVVVDNDGQVYNINVDIVVGEIVVFLGVEKLIFMIDVQGLMLDYKDSSIFVLEVNIKGVWKLIEDGIVIGGMIFKVECCVKFFV